MPTVKVALPPEREAPRQTRAGVERGTTNFINSNIPDDSTTAARLQQLAAHCGVVGYRAELLSDLVWGEVA